MAAISTNYNGNIHSISKYITQMWLEPKSVFFRVVSTTYLTRHSTNGHTTVWQCENFVQHCDGVSNHQPHYCLLNRLLGRWSKKPSKLRVTGLCAGNSTVTGEFPHKRPITWKMILFDDIIMKVLAMSASMLAHKGECVCLTSKTELSRIDAKSLYQIMYYC